LSHQLWTYSRILKQVSWAGSVAQWLSIYLLCARPEVGVSLPQEKKKNKKKRKFWNKGRGDMKNLNCNSRPKK
jgi:hypothetical protein